MAVVPGPLPFVNSMPADSKARLSAVTVELCAANTPRAPSRRFMVGRRCLKPEPDPVVPSATTRERRESAHSWNIIDFSRLWLNVGRPVPPPNTCPLAGGGVDRTAHLDGRVVRVRVDPQGDRDLAAGDLVQQPEQMVMTRFNRWLSSSSFACRFFEELRGGSSIAIASASSTVPDFAGLG